MEDIHPCSIDAVSVLEHPQLMGMVLQFLLCDAQALAAARILCHASKSITDEFILDETIEFIANRRYIVVHQWVFSTLMSFWNLKLYKAERFDERVLAFLREGKHPHVAEYWSGLGCALDKMEFEFDGKVINRQDCFRKALEIDPNTATAWSRLGAAMRRDDVAVIADVPYSKVELYTKAVLCDDDYAAPWSNLGRNLRHGSSAKVGDIVYTDQQCSANAVARERGAQAAWTAWRARNGELSLPEDIKKTKPLMLKPFLFDLMDRPSALCQMAIEYTDDMFLIRRVDDDDFERYLNALITTLTFQRQVQLIDLSSKILTRISGGDDAATIAVFRAVEEHLEGLLTRTLPSGPAGAACTIMQNFAVCGTTAMQRMINQRKNLELLLQVALQHPLSPETHHVRNDATKAIRAFVANTTEDQLQKLVQDFDLVHWILMGLEHPKCRKQHSPYQGGLLDILGHLLSNADPQDLQDPATERKLKRKKVKELRLHHNPIAVRIRTDPEGLRRLAALCGLPNVELSSQAKQFIDLYHLMEQQPPAGPKGNVVSEGASAAAL